MKRLAVICARGGSKGVRNKALRTIAGESLLYITARQARESGAFDWIALTSDSKRILDAGIDAGVDFAIKRPPKLATDTAPKIPAIRHCVQEVERSITGTVDLISLRADKTNTLW